MLLRTLRNAIMARSARRKSAPANAPRQISRIDSALLVDSPRLFLKAHIVKREMSFDCQSGHRAREPGFVEGLGREMSTGFSNHSGMHTEHERKQCAGA
jgi:hypothetical protein